ncbi:hypothetical protein Q8W71_31315 [Methylobacterium sp. NEAU 140]|uniref:hypothetical protein n=1 Tax=Methylobacterium sp. NEAU 140 TaxID=3064945 RepID=UPI0027377A25|nr:hypothetical protein [Methylobacterium sp. NEAU 140]MDP4027082.1 hypothetical protein [Methylobacterium sp. NEAU 140]
MIAAADRFGPWADGIDRTERVARLRSLRAITRLSLGPRGHAFAETLRRAETDPGQLEPALRQLDALAALDRRSVLCSFAALHRPA